MLPEDVKISGLGLRFFRLVYLRRLVLGDVLQAVELLIREVVAHIDPRFRELVELCL